MVDKTLLQEVAEGIHDSKETGYPYKDVKVKSELLAFAKAAIDIIENYQGQKIQDLRDMNIVTRVEKIDD